MAQALVLMFKLPYTVPDPAAFQPSDWQVDEIDHNNGQNPSARQDELFDPSHIQDHSLYPFQSGQDTYTVASDAECTASLSVTFSKVTVTPASDGGSPNAYGLLYPAGALFPQALDEFHMSYEDVFGTEPGDTPAQAIAKHYPVQRPGFYGTTDLRSLGYYDMYTPPGTYLLARLYSPNNRLPVYPVGNPGLIYRLVIGFIVPPAPPYVRGGRTSMGPYDYSPYGGSTDATGAPPGAPPGRTPALLGRPSYHYNRAATALDASSQPIGITFWRSNRPIPVVEWAEPRIGQYWDTPGGNAGVKVTTATGDNSPHLAEDSRSLLFLTFNRPLGGALLCRSDDDGDTWNAPTMAIPGGTHPNIVSADGRTLAAAVVNVGTASAPSFRLRGAFQGSGDAALGALFTLTDGASPLAPADDSFALAFSSEGPARVALHVRLSADTGTSLWRSSDEGAAGASWKRVATGLAGGTHPGMAQADGRLILAACVNVGTSTAPVFHIQARAQGPGDPALSSLFTFSDLSGTALQVADDSFGLAFAAEGPNRLALHVLLAGDTRTSDWWSADAGHSWTRVQRS